MSTQAVHNAYSVMSSPVVIPRTTLLCIYLMVPFSMVLVAIDIIFYESYLKFSLPVTPEDTLWYGILFGLPHILAGHITLLDKEYCKAYRFGLLFVLPTILVVSMILVQAKSDLLTYIIFTIFTMIHVIGQQVGVSRLLSAYSSGVFSAWKWSIVVLYIIVVFRLAAPYWHEENALAALLDGVLYITFVISHIPFFYLYARIHNRYGRWYLVGTQLLVMASAVFMILGYPFLGVLVPRVVHDFTAYVFYIFHDQNRNQLSHNNFLYRLIMIKNGAYVWFIPVLSISAAYLCNRFLPESVLLTLIFFHYYMDRILWKYDSPHRKYIHLG